MRLNFGQWLPDLPELLNPGALIAKNVIAEGASYRAMRGISAFSDALDGPALASIWGRAANEDIFNFVADGTKLYLLDANVNWLNVSKSGNYIAGSWDMDAFGNRILAAHENDPIQYFDMNVSSLFADLPNSPNAKYVAVLRDFVMAGHVDSNHLKVSWSGFNNSELWASSASTQAGSQDLKSRGGPIKKVVGGDIGFVFQERSITRVEYIGPPFTFRFDEVEQARGTPASNSIAKVGSKIFYYSADGFYVLDARGGGSTPIGTDRVNLWFRREVDESQIINMISGVDRRNSLIIWGFKTSSGLLFSDRLLIYNWQSDRWSYAEINVELLNEYAAPGLTLDQLDAVLPGGIDINSINVDDPVFAGGDISLLAFNPEHKACTFGGDILPFCIDTAETAAEDRFLFVNSVRPLVEVTSSGPISLTPITRDTLTLNPIVGTPADINSIGTCDVRVNARYHRYRLTGTADVRHAVGVEFNPVNKGRR